jgi:hypothetical protein
VSQRILRKLSSTPQADIIYEYFDSDVSWVHLAREGVLMWTRRLGSILKQSGADLPPGLKADIA